MISASRSRATRPRLWLSQVAALSPSEVSDGLVGVHKPKQAQEADQNNLSEDRIAVDEEGNRAANDGGLDQIKNSHITVFKFRRGQRRLCVRLLDKAAT